MRVAQLVTRCAVAAILRRKLLQASEGLVTALSKASSRYLGDASRIVGLPASMQIHMQHVIYPSEAEPVALLTPCTLLCWRPGHQVILIREEVVPSSAFRAFVRELQ